MKRNVGKGKVSWTVSFVFLEAFFDRTYSHLQADTRMLLSFINTNFNNVLKPAIYDELVIERAAGVIWDKKISQPWQSTYNNELFIENCLENPSVRLSQLGQVFRKDQETANQFIERNAAVRRERVDLVKCCKLIKEKKGTATYNISLRSSMKSIESNFTDLARHAYYSH